MKEHFLGGGERAFFWGGGEEILQLAFFSLSQQFGCWMPVQAPLTSKFLTNVEQKLVFCYLFGRASCSFSCCILKKCVFFVI